MKDLMGNELRVGDRCAIYLDAQKMGLCLCKIVEIKEGGVNLSVGGRDGNMKSMAAVRVILDITLHAHPDMPVFPVICKIVDPEGQRLGLAENLSDAIPPGTLPFKKN